MPAYRTILALLFITLGLSLGSVALLVNGFIRTPDTASIATLCADNVLAGIPAPQTCPEPTSPSELDLLQTSSANEAYPGFSYPHNWSVTLSSSHPNKRTVIHATPGIISSCEECDGPLTTVTMVTEPLPEDFSADNPDAFIAERYADSVLFANVVITQERENEGENSGRIYTITGTSNGMNPGPFTEIIFVGATSWSRVSLAENDAFPKGSAVYNAFISSLDFSLIP